MTKETKKLKKTRKPFFSERLGHPPTQMVQGASLLTVRIPAVSSVATGGEAGVVAGGSDIASAAADIHRQHVSTEKCVLESRGVKTAAGNPRLNTTPRVDSGKRVRCRPESAHARDPHKHGESRAFAKRNRGVQYPPVNDGSDARHTGAAAQETAADSDGSAENAFDLDDEFVEYDVAKRRYVHTTNRTLSFALLTHYRDSRQRKLDMAFRKSRQADDEFCDALVARCWDASTARSCDILTDSECDVLTDALLYMPAGCRGVPADASQSCSPHSPGNGQHTPGSDTS